MVASVDNRSEAIANAGAAMTYPTALSVEKPSSVCRGAEGSCLGLRLFSTAFRAIDAKRQKTCQLING